MSWKTYLVLIILVASNISTFIITKSNSVNIAAISETSSVKKSETKTEDKTVETTKRTTVKPDGTIVYEDIVKDYFVMQTQNENIELKKKVSEFKKHDWHIAFIPTYRFDKPLILNSIEYNFLIERRIILDCYAGVLLSNVQIGASAGCYY